MDGEQVQRPRIVQHVCLLEFMQAEEFYVVGFPECFDEANYILCI